MSQREGAGHRVPVDTVEPFGQHDCAQSEALHIVRTEWVAPLDVQRKRVLAANVSNRTAEGSQAVFSNHA